MARSIYAAVGVSSFADRRDILGLWAGQGSETAKFWLAVLSDRREGGIKDIFFVICDVLKGPPEAVGNIYLRSRPDVVDLPDPQTPSGSPAAGAGAS